MSESRFQIYEQYKQNLHARSHEDSKDLGDLHELLRSLQDAFRRIQKGDSVLFRLQRPASVWIEKQIAKVTHDSRKDKCRIWFEGENLNSIASFPNYESFEYIRWIPIMRNFEDTETMTTALLKLLSPEELPIFISKDLLSSEILEGTFSTYEEEEKNSSLKKMANIT